MEDETLIQNLISLFDLQSNNGTLEIRALLKILLHIEIVSTQVRNQG